MSIRFNDDIFQKVSETLSNYTQLNELALIMQLYRLHEMKFGQREQKMLLRMANNMERRIQIGCRVNTVIDLRACFRGIIRCSVN